MIFLFYGPNTYAARRKLTQMSETYIEKAGSNFGLLRVDGATADAKTITSALLAAPFLANSRLVVMDGLSKNKAVMEAVLNILDQVPSSTVAVFYEPAIDERTIVFKSLLAKSKPAKFAKLSPYQLSAWIKREAERQRATIEKSAVDLLLETAGEDQWRLEQEIAKLASYHSKITIDSVRELVVPSFSQNIFDLVDAIVAGDSKRALLIYRGLIAEQTNEIYILSMIIWQLRNLLLAQASGRMTAGELAKATGMSPYVAAKSMQKRSNYDEEVLKGAFLMCVNCDFAIKTGAGKPQVLVEQLIWKLSSSSNLTGRRA